MDAYVCGYWDIFVLRDSILHLRYNSILQYYSLKIVWNMQKSKYGGIIANVFSSWFRQLIYLLIYWSLAFTLFKYLSFTPSIFHPDLTLIDTIGEDTIQSFATMVTNPCNTNGCQDHQALHLLYLKLLRYL